MWMATRYLVGILFWLVVFAALLMPDTMRPAVSALSSFSGLGSPALGRTFVGIAIVLGSAALFVERRFRTRLGVWIGWRSWLQPAGRKQSGSETALLLQWIAMACFVFGVAVSALYTI